MLKITEWKDVVVQVQWRKKPDANGHRYAILRWTGPDGPDTLTLGRTCKADADTQRTLAESRLRLQQPVRLEPKAVSYTVLHLVCDYVAYVETSRSGAEHKARVMLDAESLIRHLGSVECDHLARVHTLLFRDRRGAERRVQVRRRNAETDDEWATRRAEDRVHGGGKPISGKVIRNEIATLRRAQTFAIGLRRPAGVPVPLLRESDVGDDARPARRLTEDEVRALTEAGHKLYTSAEGLGWLIQTHAWSGRRPVALYALQVKHCDRLRDHRLQRHQQLVWWEADKGGRNRGYSPLTQPALEAVLARLEELGDASGDTFLWTTAGGKPWTSNGFGTFWRRIRDASGVQDVQLYDLRRHACAQLAARLSSQVAIKFSGHTNPVTFAKIYAFAMQGSAEFAAESVTWSPPTLRDASLESVK